jgi:glycosyltransferase involved in cell wall biosynthesis
MSPVPQPFTSRADLHVHTRYSDRPSEWVLRRIGSAESYVEPRHVYDRAIAAGMSFVTISDHNKIDGALEIAHLPRTFISSEITTYFPENGAKMHILVTGISGEQFDVIQKVRTDIHEFRRYVLEQDIIYSVAHPLFLVNDRLTVEQFEQLLVMFNRFEIINGTRDPRAGGLVKTILDNLTRRDIERLADKYGIEPVGADPHRKLMTGGSDDHSGLYIASANTVTPEASSVEEFLEHLRRGRHKPGGSSGSSIHLAHCLYSIAHAYYKERILSKSAAGSSLLGEMLKRLLEPQPQQKPARGVRAKVNQWVWKRKQEKMSETEQLLVTEFSALFQQQRESRPATGSSGAAANAFEISCRLAHQLGYTFLRRFTEKAGSGDLVKSLEAVAALGPVAAAISPYLAAFKTQHKDERFIQVIASHFDATRHLRQRSDKRAWVTDTIDDVNGVAHTIKTMARTAHRQQRPLTVLTCVEQYEPEEYSRVNFRPVGMFNLPEYEAQRLAFPPFLQILEYIERERFGELIISTPGPLGVTALIAAKLMHLRTVGIYHTDFPHYVRALTDDPGLEALTWRYMTWFFSQCDTILAPSAYYRDRLIDRGFAADRIRILQRGVDTADFHPDKGDPSFWREFGGEERTTILYAGRISTEKNIDMLADAYERLAAERQDVQLAFVGDGPALPQLKKRFADRSDVVFTGFLRGESLARAYASADLFVFPSTTDTFGNAVLEAQAAGLPAIVSDQGGPQEIVRPQNSGLILNLEGNGAATQRLVDAMRELVDDRERRQELAERGRAHAEGMTWDDIFADLWDGREHVQSNALQLTG